MDDMYDAAWTRVRRASTFRDEAGACGCAVRVGGCAVHGAVNGAGGAGGRHCEGGLSASRGAGRGVSRPGECWSGVESDRAYVLDPSKNKYTQIWRSHSYTVIPYTACMWKHRHYRICKSDSSSLLIG